VVILGYAGMALSVLGLVILFLNWRKPARVRSWLDLTRLLITAGVLTGMIVVLAVTTPVWLAGAAGVLGLVLGLGQGRGLEIESTAKGLMAKRRTLGLLATGGGVVVVQAASLLNRAGIVRIGMTLSFLSIGVTAGLIAGRGPAIRRARQVVAPAPVQAASVMLAVLLAVAAVLLVSQPPAEAQQVGCADSVNGWPLSEETLREGNGGFTTINCTYSEPGDDTFGSIQITARWTAEFDQDFLLCGVDNVGSGSDSVTWFASETTTANGTVRVFAPGSTVDQAAVDAATATLFAQVEAVAASCTDLRGEPPPGGFGAAESVVVPGFDAEAADGIIELTGGISSIEEFYRVTTAQMIELGILGIARNEAVVRLDPEAGTVEGLGTLVFRFDSEPIDRAIDEGLSEAFEGVPEAFGQTPSETEFVPEPCFYLASIRYEIGGRWDPDSGQMDGEVIIPADPPTVILGCAGTEFDVEPNPPTTFTGTFDGSVAEMVIAAIDPESSGPLRVRVSTDGLSAEELGITPPSGEFASEDQFIDDSGFGGFGSDGAEDGDAGENEDTTSVGIDGTDETDAAFWEDLFADDVDIDEEDAAWAALLGLLGVSAMGVTALLDSGAGLADLLRGSRSDDGDQAWVDGDGVFVFDDPAAAARLAEELQRRQAAAGVPPGALIDEFGNVLSPGDDGLFDWETPDGTERLGRDEVRERIEAARAANAARDARQEAIVAGQEDEAAAAERFDDLGARIVSDNDAAMQEVRDGWDRVDELAAQAEARERALGALEAAEADQDLATLQDSWGQIFSETAQASWNDATEIPGLMVDGTRAVVQAATDPENWTVLLEGGAETIYDTAGFIMGGAFGDGAESVQQGAVTATRVAAALGGQFVRHPVDTAAMFIPGRDFYDALDGDRPLGQRLGSVAMGVLDVGATLAGAGVLSHADELVDASRAMDAATDIADASRVVDAGTDSARATAAAVDAEAAADVVGAAGSVQGQMADAARLRETAAEAREAARVAVASGNSADAARAMDAAADAERAADAAQRSLFQGQGMQAMGDAEAAGRVSDELAQSVVGMHDELTGAASRQGLVDAVDDFAGEFGFQPREVMMGNSGSVGAGRSVMTDADRTIVATFSRDQLGSARRAGESYSQTQSRLQGRLTELHQRAAELQLNSARDPAVVLARQQNLSLGEAVAALGDADDPAAAAMRLSGNDMDMASYAGFGSGAGQADSYGAGYTTARQATQGSTEVFTFGDRASDGRSYATSGQAIVDRNELSQMDLRTWDADLQQLERSQGLDTPLANAADIDVGWGSDETLGGLDMARDPTRIGESEMRGLFEQQQAAMGRYDDAKSISKAVDRASYVAGRVSQPLPNQQLVDAARTIRADPRATQDVLNGLAMTESEYVAALKDMMVSYQPVFPS
jgi:hypothetical protein